MRRDIHGIEGLRLHHTYTFLREWWWPWKGPIHALFRATIILSRKNTQKKSWCNRKPSLACIFTMETTQLGVRLCFIHISRMGQNDIILFVTWQRELGAPGGGGGALPYWRWRGRAAEQGMIFTVIHIGTGYLNRPNWLLAGCSVYNRVASRAFPRVPSGTRAQ